MIFSASRSVEPHSVLNGMPTLRLRLDAIIVREKHDFFGRPVGHSVAVYSAGNSLNATKLSNSAIVRWSVVLMDALYDSFAELRSAHANACT